MNSITMSKINEIDLDQIKVKLMHQESGEGWSAQRADAIEVEYRRFLCMMHMYPQENFAPLLDVDTFWHYHILDTRKYAADCEQTFGYFLHHHPYVGLGEDDAADHQAFGERMHALYQDTFGEACLSGAHAAGQAATAWCSRVDVEAAATAWCSRVDGKPQATAWCSRVDGTLQATAWCSRVDGKQQTAWCSLSTAGKSGQQTAWCSLKKAEKSAQQTAWCSLNTAGKAAQQTAWCSLNTAGKAAQQTAWCSLNTAGKAAQQTAWCSLNTAGKAAQQTAWCSLNTAGKAAQPTAWCSQSAAAQVTAWCSATITGSLQAA